MAYHLPRIHRDTFLVIRTDGSQEAHDFPFRRGSARLAAVEQALGCGTLDFVTLRQRHGRSPALVMAVNDLGWETDAVEQDTGRTELVPMRARFPVNPKATELYLRVATDTTHHIVGDVAVMFDDE